MTTTIDRRSARFERARRGRVAGRTGALPRWAALVSLAAALTLSPAAMAQENGSIDQARMARDLRAYFHGEKVEAPFFIGTGLAAGGVGALLVTRDDDLARGAAYPTFGIGLVQLIIGTTLLLNTDARVARLDQQLATDPAGFKKSEMERMDGVHTSFLLVMLFESALIVGGATTAVAAAQSGCCRTLQGIGLGMAGQGAVSLALDFFAAVRAREYSTSLSRFDVGISAAPLSGQFAPGRFGSISFGGRF